MSPRIALAAFAVTSALLAPPVAVAVADDAVADLVRETPISAYGGAVAWSAYDAASGRYALVIRQRETTTAARVASARRPFDVSLGPDAAGRVVALYTRCRTPTRGCDVYRYDLRARRERRLSAISSPVFDEAWPAQWRGRVAFVRRARAHVKDGDDHRPDRTGRGPVMACDVPLVKTLSSRAPSRRLDRSQCGTTTGVAIRDATIAVVTDIDQGGAGSDSQVRALRASGGAARILARTTGGEGGYSPFASPNLSRSAVWLTRTGRREGVAQGFVRIGLRDRRLVTVPEGLTFGDAIARDERGRFWYIQGPQPDFDAESRCAAVLEPCRLVRAAASPFSSTPRTLLARLALDVADFDTITAFAADPPVLSGRLVRPVIRRGAVVTTVPVPGVTLDLLRTSSLSEPGPYAQTGRSTTTDANGRWAFSLRDPPPRQTLVVVAPGPRVASIVVEVVSSARIVLTADGRTLSGTVAPAQPGRTVQIQRLSVDARGRPLAGGPQVCVLPVTPAHCADDAWATVAQAPIGADGASFAAVVDGPGEYRARLSFDSDPRARTTAYGGVSPTVHVA
ncbi:MAG TPA: hypothetical protein VMY78_07595 [Solirubrobacteraceae bacterium]|nr:hypothetical protein [Solirubrobacteraceae bacterium]